MDDRQANKSRDSNIIKMTIPDRPGGFDGFYSAVHRINGFPWRLRVCPSSHRNDRSNVALLCDKSNESTLWTCAATVSVLSPLFLFSGSGYTKKAYSFASWTTHECIIMSGFDSSRKNIEVEIDTKENGECFRPHLSLDPILDPRDVALVVGAVKIYVNKMALAAHSEYFKTLFFGLPTSTHESEIEIKDAEPNDLDNLIRLTYDLDGQSMNMDNVDRMVQLAGMFDLKIIEEKVVNFVLGCEDLSIHQKFVISERLGLQKFKDEYFSTTGRVSSN
ncbi:hypothetical protein PFISCL1PPCAC_12292 [Pristionchus fissidentatus]|uniref:BTB domain-containing protein n=1 Tax=Pristionchus fissidentatus TaxID=1538716 RepID=A0AAV5VTA6_9BILA|nr:hypothetical protein PFISCL1PPCAC_12292 [Pristionchus fissidentatus]